MVDASCEVDLGRLEGVVGREVDGEEEYTARVWGVALKRESVLFASSGQIRCWIYFFCTRGGSI
jgi:hypothetical protein